MNWFIDSATFILYLTYALLSAPFWGIWKAMLWIIHIMKLWYYEWWKGVDIGE